MAERYCMTCEEWFNVRKNRKKCSECGHFLSPGRLVRDPEEVKGFVNVRGPIKKRGKEKIIKMIADSGAIFKVRDPAIVKSLLLDESGETVQVSPKS